MKILLLTDNLKPGGKQRRLIELIKGFQNYPDVDLNLVIFSDTIHYTEIFELGISVKVLKRVPKKNPMAFYRLFELCKIWKPDLIHSWGTMSTILAIPSSILLNIRLINENIADAPDNMGLFDQRLIRARLTFPFSKVIIGNSIAGLKAYSAPKDKSVCIYNGFDLNRIVNLKEKVAIRRQFEIYTEKVIGMVGSFHGLKDYETYTEAAILVMRKRDNVTFVAVGNGPDLLYFKKRIPAEYTSRFIFTGLQKDVESIINVFNIGVLSTYTEGISNAILECMALEKPVVASIGGGTVETIENIKTGFLIPPSSPEVLANKLIYLLDNPEVALKMGHKGRNRLDSMFSLDRMTKAYYTVYQRLLI